jgi:hypothetical protein
MSRISELKRADDEKAPHGIYPKDNAQINQVIDRLAAEYKETGDLWEAVGPNFLDGLGQLAKKTQTTPAIMVQILARGARKPQPRPESKSDKFSFWFRQHGLEALVLAIILAGISLLLTRALMRLDTVVLNSDLPAYHVIEEKDLIVEKRVRTPASFASKEDVIGRYLLQPAAQGVLATNQVSAIKLQESDRAEMQQTQIIFLPVKAGAFNTTLTPPAHVRLLFSPRQRAEPLSAPLAIENLSVDDAVVLAVNPQGDSASLTIGLRTPQDVAKLTSLMGVADVFVSEPIKK